MERLEKKTGKNKHLHMRLTDEEYRWFKETAKICKTSMSDLLWIAFRSYLADFSNDELADIYSNVCNQDEKYVCEEVGCDSCKFLHEDWCILKVLYPCDKRVYCDDYKPKAA